MPGIVLKNKYSAQRTGKYASKKEAAIARDLWILADCGKIEDLKEQVKFELVPGRNGVRPICYYADFTYVDEDKNLHVCDVKGMKTPVFRLKEKMMYLLLGITVELL
jgi:Protein of unknown function (DUF1064)